MNLNLSEYKRKKDEITREEARKLVRLGLYRSVAEAWNEATILCEAGEKYDVLKQQKNVDSI